jgi:uncharacterized alpha/beta hydrolase family protein
VKKLVHAFLWLFGTLVFSGAGWASDVAITSVGHASDGMMVKVLMNKLKIDTDYDSAFPARKLGAQKVIIAVVGASSKGLGAIGIKKEEEKTRSTTLLKEAKKRGIKVLVMHIGGDRRRGELTDTFIEAVAGMADRLIIVKSGNSDGIFTRAKSSDAPLTEVESVQASVPALEATLKEWGVTK